jgi:hypothetical protein
MVDEDFAGEQKGLAREPTRPVESSTIEERGAPVARLQSRILPAATGQITKI